MKRFAVLIAVTLFILTAMGTSFAQAQHGIHHRIQDQQRRIDHGVRDGSLTHREADILRDNLDHIRHAYERYRADGALTYREEDKLNRMLHQNSNMIRRMQHNEIRRLY